MEEMGKEMIKHCGGLPLAVKLLGGLLSKRTLSGWKKIHKNIGSHVVGGTSFNDRNIDSVYHILYLSYEELPGYLKHCFLYLAHFREDEEINVEKLAYYWAGDGILRPRCYDGDSIRDVGDGYIEELVKRNMVISERDVRTSRFETCQLHDMMREVCLVKAEEENFLQIVQGPSTANSESPYKSRRLVYHGYIDNVERVAENPKLRSLLLFGYYDWSACGLRFTRLQLMRVLDLSFSESTRVKLPSSIGKLIHLRYLSLGRLSLRRIPSSMRNLKQLLYLNLDVDGEVYMPNILKEMRKLTYLHLPRRLHDKVNMELGNLVNLETLKNFSTKHGCVRDLQGMTRLRTLSIYMEEEDPGQSTWLSSYLGQLRYLENLTIIDNHIGRREFVLECVELRHLELDIYMPRLPDDQHLPSHLIYLNLSGCRLEEDPMPILEKLGQLEKVCLGRNSFCGRRMVCSRGGFPQLQKLELTGLKELEEWIVEEGSMPLLHTLTIDNCKALKELRDGLRFITSLKVLSVIMALKELRDGLRFITSLKVVTVIIGGGWNEKLLEHHLPSRGTSLTLSWYRLGEDPMPILEKLGQLEKVYFRRDSFCGRRMVCSRGGFTRLQKLELTGLKELEEWIIEEGSMPLLDTLWICDCEKLEEWIVEEGSMPLLHTLTIDNCNKLTELRDGLRFITSLKVVTVIIGEGWKEKLLEQHLPSRLTSLKLSDCCLEEDPMPILENMLHLRELDIREKAFCGRRMVCSRGGFPQLRDLRLYGLEELEEWIVEEGSMPLLHTLDIGECEKLKELPDGLRFITSLTHLDVSVMGDEWKKRLSEGGEDYYKIQHIPNVSFHFDWALTNVSEEGD